MHIGVDVKAAIEENVKAAIRTFEEREDIVTKFGEPVIGYANARSSIFDMFFSRGLSNHPKSIYRPGNTIVLHFVPYDPAVAAANEASAEPSEAWNRAFIESMWLSMRLNGVIRETLDTVGRLSSCINTPTDWNEETCHEEWSHKMAAYAAGMGEFGPAGSFHTKNGYAGRLGAIITDGFYADACEEPDSQQLEQIYQNIMTSCCYENAPDVSCSQDMINACPCGAISPTGINRKKCQEYCKTIDEYIPSPDICGKCFRFR